MFRWTADFPGGHPCIVCSNADPCHHLLDIVDNRTIKERLEEVLELSVDKTTTQWLCELCYTNLRCIEEYYTLLTSFKKQYTQNAISRGELAQGSDTGAGAGAGIRTDSHGNNSSSQRNSAHILSAVRFGEELLQNLGADEMETSIRKPSLAPPQSLQTKSQAKVAEAPQNVDSGDREGTGEEEKDGANNDSEGDDGGDVRGDDFMEDDDFGERVNEDLIHERERDQHEGETNSNSKESSETGLTSPVKTVLDEKSYNSGNASSSSKPSDESLTLKKTRKPRSSKKKKKSLNESCEITDFPKKTHVEKTFSCLQCDQIFQKYRTLAEHMKTHHNDSSHVCHCGKSFPNAKRLRIHKNTHTGEKKKICPKCGKVLKSNHSLMMHMDLHQTEGPYEFVCEICNAGFHYRGSWKQHMNKHETGKHVCTICGMSFTQGHSLQKHNLIHMDEKPLLCSYCGKTFRHGSSLKCHLLSHTGKYQHRCQICNKGFFRKIDLTRHGVTHSNK